MLDLLGIGEKGSGTNSRNGPKGASHYWYLTPFRVYNFGNRTLECPHDLV